MTTPEPEMVVDAPLLSPTPQVVADQYRTSMKLKEQQKALIESRRASVVVSPASAAKKSGPSLTIWTAGSPSETSAAGTTSQAPLSSKASGSHHVSALPRVDSLISPRHDRELPPPTGQPRPNSLPPMTVPPMSSRPNLSPMNGMNASRSLPMSRPDFTRFFDHMYDQSEHAHHLVNTLNDQVRHSASLLQTLQASGTMIEGLVRGHFREMQSQIGEKFGLALTDLNRRMRVIEDKLGIVPPTPERANVSPRSETPKTAQATPSTTTPVSGIQFAPVAKAEEPQEQSVQKSES